MIGLHEWQRGQLEERLFARPAWSEGDWLFADELGRLLRPDHVGPRSTGLQTGAANSTVDDPPVETFPCDRAPRGWCPPKVVQERFHSSIAIIMNVYSGVQPGMQRDAVEKLAAIIG